MYINFNYLIKWNLRYMIWINDNVNDKVYDMVCDKEFVSWIRIGIVIYLYIEYIYISLEYEMESLKIKWK